MNNHTFLFVILDDNEELGNRKRPRHVRSHGNNRNEAENPQVQPVLHRDDRNEAEDPQVQPAPCRNDRNNAQGPQVPIQDDPAWQWINTQGGGNYRPRNISFQGNPGLVNPIPNEEPYSFFKLYFTDAVIDKIVEEMKRYA